MSNTPKGQPDPDAIDASISVLGEEGGEPKVAGIERTLPSEPRSSVEQAGESGRQENVEAPIEESEAGAGRARGTGSVERPGNDPDLV